MITDRKTHTGHIGHVPAPLRRLHAVSPSGHAAYFWKYTDDMTVEQGLSFGICGNPTALELQTFRKARTLARHPGPGAWQAAIELLAVAGWTVNAE